MSVVNDGLVTVTGGLNEITGSGTLFNQTQVGMIFTLPGFLGAWQIAEIVSDTLVRLSSPIETIVNGLVIRETPYFISSDFTPMFDIPYHNQGDRDTATVLKRALDTIDVMGGHLRAIELSNH